jgi:hypothetical protein
VSETVAAFAKALAAFQSDLPKVGKGQTAKVPTKSGGSYSYSYADLADITEVALPLLTKHGLSFSARPTLMPDGFVLAYSLLHTGGHVEGGLYPLPDPERNGPQAIGSAITYARRYALCAVTGIAPEDEDDDAASAVAATSGPSNGQKWGGQKRQQREFADPNGKKAERSSGTPEDDEFAVFSVEVWEVQLASATTAGELDALARELKRARAKEQIDKDTFFRLRDAGTARRDELGIAS